MAQAMGLYTILTHPFHHVKIRALILLNNHISSLSEKNFFERSVDRIMNAEENALVITK